MRSIRWLVLAGSLTIVPAFVAPWHSARCAGADRMTPRERGALTKAVLAANRGQEYALTLDGYMLETLNEIIDREGVTWPMWEEWGPKGAKAIDLGAFLGAVATDVHYRPRDKEHNLLLPFLPDPRESASMAEYRTKVTSACDLLVKATSEVEKLDRLAKEREAADTKAQEGVKAILTAVKRWMKGLTVAPKYSDLLARDDQGGPFLTKEQTIDPWGTEYRFSVDIIGRMAVMVLVESAGPDRKFGTWDDIKERGT